MTGTTSTVTTGGTIDIEDMLQTCKDLLKAGPREITLSSHPMVPEGKQVLLRNGQVVCIVSVGKSFGDQTGDVVFDHIQMSPSDYMRFERASALTGKDGSAAS